MSGYFDTLFLDGLAPNLDLDLCFFPDGPKPPPFYGEFPARYADTSAPFWSPSTTATAFSAISSQLGQYLPFNLLKIVKPL